jgi:hypothetical protein
MSNLKDLFNDIKNVFKEEGIETDTEASVETTQEVETTETTDISEEVKSEKFEDVVLEDGTVAQVEPDVSIGSAVVVAVDDELLPAPDGEHVLADGRAIVTEGGVIVAVEEAEEMPEVEEEVAEEEVQEEMETEKPFTEAQEREAKKIIESIVTERVFSMETSISVDNEELKKQVEKLTTAFNGLLELTEKLIAEPTKEAVKKTKSGFAKLKTNKRDIIEALKNKNIIN